MEVWQFHLPLLSSSSGHFVDFSTMTAWDFPPQQREASLLSAQFPMRLLHLGSEGSGRSESDEWLLPWSSAQSRRWMKNEGRARGKISVNDSHLHLPFCSTCCTWRLSKISCCQCQSQPSVLNYWWRGLEFSKIIHLFAYMKKKLGYKL